MSHATVRAIQRDPAVIASRPLDSLRVEVFRLVHADARDVAATLRTLLFDGATANDSRIRAIFPDRSSNALIVFGTAEGVMRVRELVVHSLGPRDASDDGRTTELVHLRHANAPDVFRVVRPVAGHDTDVVVDVRTNALVLSGDAASVARIRDVASSLDVAVPASP